jgi:hypothetical protein
MKKYILIALAVVVTTAFAGWVASEYISIRLVIQNGAAVFFLPNSNQYMYGTGGLYIGDSVTVYAKTGAAPRFADTSAFSTTLASKAIYIKGAKTSDVYSIQKRIIYGVSTAMPADSCILSYMALADSLIVLRQPGATSAGQLPSGTKFSWIRVSLN